jgi:hypothetical protein
MSDPADRVACPGCSRPLHVPPSALGQAVHCPHCKANFRVPGAGGPPEPLAARPARFGVPKLLLGPGFALLMVGVTAATVNGVLLGRFLLRPGADLDHARWQVQELRNQQLELLAKEAKKGEPPPAPPDTSAADEELARAWVQRLVPFHAGSLALGLLAAAGGVATLTGRLYPLALAGCVAAAVNVNYLCCVPGAAAGAWAGLMLVRDEGRRHFQRS